MKEMLEEYGGVAVCVIMGLVILGIFISMFKGNGSLASDVWKVLMSPMLEEVGYAGNLRRIRESDRVCDRDPFHFWVLFHPEKWIRCGKPSFPNGDSKK